MVKLSLVQKMLNYKMNWTEFFIVSAFICSSEDSVIRFFPIDFCQSNLADFCFV